MDRIPKEFSDVRVKVGKKVYDLHKIILIKLPFFDKELRGKFKKSDLVEIEDIDNQAFEKIIDCLYGYALLGDFGLVPYDLEPNEIDTALILGMNEEVDDFISSNELRTKDFFSGQDQDYKIAELDFYLHRNILPMRKRYIDLIEKLLFKFAIEDELRNYPFIFYFYNAYFRSLGRWYDNTVDYTDVYNVVFNKDVKEISVEKALDAYIKAAEEV